MQPVREIRFRSIGRRFRSVLGNTNRKGCTSTSSKFGAAREDKLFSKPLAPTFHTSRLSTTKLDVALHLTERSLYRKSTAMEGLLKSPGQNTSRAENPWENEFI